MSDIENQNELPVLDELATLKQRADMMGISYHPSIKVDALRAKVAAKLNDEPDPDDEKPSLDKAEATGAPKVETELEIRRRLKEDATKLVRINVTCMNPAKREWEGEIFTVSNKYLPTQKKFVPFNTTEGYHVPKIIFDMMQARQCQIFVTEKAKNGVKIRKGKLIKEFAIEVLDPLTPKELKELAQRQAMANGQAS